MGLTSVFLSKCLLVINATQKPLLAMVLGLQESVLDIILDHPASLDHIGVIGPMGHLNPWQYTDTRLVYDGQSYIILFTLIKTHHSSGINWL